VKHIWVSFACLLCWRSASDLTHQTGSESEVERHERIQNKRRFGKRKSAYRKGEREDETRRQSFALQHPKLETIVTPEVDRERQKSNALPVAFVVICFRMFVSTSISTHLFFLFSLFFAAQLSSFTSSHSSHPFYQTRLIIITVQIIIIFACFFVRLLAFSQISS
jgi:hypothetical protein